MRTLILVACFTLSACASNGTRVREPELRATPGKVVYCEPTDVFKDCKLVSEREIRDIFK